ncbi:MAG TPA: hypothetical protein VFO77_09855, partial [Actinoplanes sp.]|nr:hypothetical protein [Actinoplanes sp.]
PPWALSPLIEFGHRVVAIAAGPLILVAALSGLRLPGLPRWVRVLPWWALIGAAAAAAFGRRVVLDHLPAWLGAVDLACALTALTAITVAAAVVGRVVNDRPLARDARATVRRSAAAGLVTLLVLHVTGILVAGPGSFTATVGWPMWRVLDSDHHGWLQVVRVAATAVILVLAGVTAAAAAKAGGDRSRVRLGAFTMLVLCAAELVLGLVIRATGLDRATAAAYAVLAVAVFWSFACLVAAGVPSQGAAERSDGRPREVVAAA